MGIQTVSDELYRRHEREWAELRNAVEASEANQRQQEKASGQTSCDHKTSGVSALGQRWGSARAAPAASPGNQMRRNNW